MSGGRRQRASIQGEPMNSLSRPTDVLRLDASVVQFFAMLDVRAPASITSEHLQELLVDAEIAVAAMSGDRTKASAAALAQQLLGALRQQLTDPPMAAQIPPGCGHPKFPH